MSAFSMPAAATNKDNRARIGMIDRQSQEVVSVAAHQKQAVFTGVTERLDVVGLNGQDRSQFRHLVAFLPDRRKPIRLDLRKTYS